MTAPQHTSIKLAIIWDMDGVIVDTEIHHFNAWRKLLRPQGIELSEAAFKRTFGMRNEEIIKSFLGPDTPEQVIHQLAQQKEVYFRQFVRDNIVANPGAIGLIRDLSNAGFLQAVASSAPRENIELILSSLRIAQHFAVVISAEDVRLGKPDPEIFLLAAHRLGVEPSQCAVIEDSIAGIQAALAAHMRCIALASTYTPDRLTAADVVVESLEDLKASDIKEIITQRRA